MGKCIDEIANIARLKNSQELQAVAKFVEVTRILSENLVTEIEKLAKKTTSAK